MIFKDFPVFVRSLGRVQFRGLGEKKMFAEEKEEGGIKMPRYFAQKWEWLYA